MAAIFWLGENVIWPGICICCKVICWLCENLIWPGICICYRALLRGFLLCADGAYVCATDRQCRTSAIVTIALVLLVSLCYILIVEFLAWLQRTIESCRRVLDATFHDFSHFLGDIGPRAERREANTFINTRMVHHDYHRLHSPGNHTRNHDAQKYRHVSRASAEREILRMRQNSHIYEGTERLNAYYNDEFNAWFVGRSRWT